MCSQIWNHLESKQPTNLYTLPALSGFYFAIKKPAEDAGTKLEEVFCLKGLGEVHNYNKICRQDSMFGKYDQTNEQIDNTLRERTVSVIKLRPSENLQANFTTTVW